MVKDHRGDVIRVCIWGNRHIRCTAEHPFLTENRGYVAAIDLRNDDWVAIPRYMPELVESIVPAEYLEQTTHTIQRRTYAHVASSKVGGLPGKPQTEVRRTPVPELIVLNESFGRICGLYLAEGSISCGKITFTFNENEVDTLVAELCDLWMNEFGVKTNVCVNRGKKRTCDVKVYGSGWCHLFENLFGSGSAIKSLHPDISSGPRDFLTAMLNGWQAGDGLGEAERCGGVTVSHALAMNMYDIANAIGKNPTVETLQVKINPKHKIKHRHLRYIVAWPSNPDAKSRARKTESVMWRRVDKIEAEPFNGVVYNIEVEEDHSYVVEGVGVHNCNGYALANAAWRAAYAGGNTKLTKRSGSYAYSLMNNGRDQGSELFRAFQVGQEYGLPSLVSCPWNLIYRNDTRRFDTEAALFKVDAPLLIHSWDELITAWAGPFFTVIAVQVGRNFERLNGDVLGIDQGPGNHAVAQSDSRLNSRGDIQGKVIMNWGLQHGVRGCGWIGYEHVRETMKYHQVYAIPVGQHGSGTVK
jgi:hypothetical protein